MKCSPGQGVKGLFILQASSEGQFTPTQTHTYTYVNPHTPVQTEALSEQCVDTT